MRTIEPWSKRGGDAAFVAMETPTTLPPTAAALVFIVALTLSNVMLLVSFNARASTTRASRADPATVVEDMTMAAPLSIASTRTAATRLPEGEAETLCKARSVHAPKVEDVSSI